MTEDRNYISLATLHCLYNYFIDGDEFFIDVGKLRVEHYEMKDHLVISNDAARHLELISNNHDHQSKTCLFKLFSPVTYGGGKFILL